MLGGEDISGIGDRSVVGKSPKRSHSFILENEWVHRTYVLEEPIGSQIDFIVGSENDIGFDVIDSFGGSYASIDEGLSGPERSSIVVDLPGPIFVVVYQFDPVPATVDINCTCELRLLSDTDDSREITRGDIIIGNIDVPNDGDSYIISLNKGESIDISMSSIVVDPYIVVGWVGSSVEDLTDDDDSGGGLFGTDARVTFQAPHSGEFTVSVYDAFLAWPGGYEIRIN
jgi:hypothetical protein